MIVILFFKQNTSYEMRISDWSSDVCSSDLVPPPISIASAPEEQGPWSRRAGHPLADWKFEIANDDTRLDYLDWIAAREVNEAGDTVPRAKAVSPDLPQLYLHLYHGRKDPDESLEDWGSDGPVIGPLANDPPPYHTFCRSLIFPSRSRSP